MFHIYQIFVVITHVFVLGKALEAILEDGLSDAKNAIEAAILAEQESASATKRHTQLLRDAMDSEGKEGNWETATEAFSSKSDRIALADSLSEEAR